MTVTISPKQTMRLITRIIFVLAILNIVVRLIRDFTGHGRLMGFGSMFNFGAESNIPTWFSSSLLILCSSLLWIIASAMKQSNSHNTLQWRGLSLIFLYLSIDESCTIHETIGTVFLKIAGNSPISKFGWTFPAIVVLLILALIYMKFLVTLPATTRKLFIAAGAIYIGSAVILEAIGGLWSTAHSTANIIYTVEVTMEETGEMLGLALFIYALMSYITEHMPDVSVNLAETQIRITPPIDLYDTAPAPIPDISSR